MADLRPPTGRLLSDLGWPDAGITDHRRAEALDTHPLFIDSVARQVERHIEADR